MTDQHQEANLDGTFDAFKASGCTFDAVTPDMIARGFRGLPLWERMREAASVLREAEKRAGSEAPHYWAASILLASADRWEAEDRVAAERERLVKELRQEILAGVISEVSNESPWNSAEIVARKLIDAGWNRKAVSGDE